MVVDNLLAIRDIKLKIIVWIIMHLVVKKDNLLELIKLGDQAHLNLKRRQAQLKISNL